MQSLKGKLTKLQDILVVLDILKEKGGKVTFKLPFQEEKLEICSDSKKFYISTTNEELKKHGPQFIVQRFIENWLSSRINPTFEIENGKCEDGIELEEKLIIKLVQENSKKKIEKFPELFRITEIKENSAPRFLKNYWKSKTPIGREELYQQGLTVKDLIELIENDILEIKTYKKRKSFPAYVLIVTLSLLLGGAFYSLLPTYLLDLNSIKIKEAINWGLREEILEVEGPKPLPVKNCFKANIYFINGRVVDPGIDGKIHTEDDKSYPLPKKGYKPVFAIPVK